MAKKQGINYNPNTALIRGAAVAYQDYDNMPGMYSGIDEVTKSGLGMVEGAVEDFEAEENKKQEIEKRWDMTSDQILLKAGALGDVLYGSTREDIVKLRKLYLEGVNEKDDKKRMQAMIGLQNHSNFIQDHKQVNLDYAKAKTDGTLSSYYTEDPEGRKEAHIIEQISGQKYNKTSRKDGDVVFHIPAYESEDGSVKYEAMEVTSEEYNDMMTPKNFKITAAYTSARLDSYKQENFEEDFFRQKVKNSLPKNKRDWKAAAYDDVSGKNLKEMLRTSETLDQEIINAVNANAWDGKNGGIKDGVLQKEEKEAFIDAVTNTENDFWNLENSNQILEDQLVNAGRNSHASYWRDKNKNKKDGLQLSYGYQTWAQMQDTYDKIKQASPGDVLSYRGTIFEPQADGTFRQRGGDNKEVFSKQYLRNLFELGHLPAFETIEVESDPPPNVVEEESKGDSSIPMPKDRGLTSVSFDDPEGESQIIGELETLYAPYGDFKFEKSMGNLLITSPTGETISVNMDRKFRSSGAETKIQKFISKHAKQK